MFDSLHATLHDEMISLCNLLIGLNGSLSTCYVIFQTRLDLSNWLRLIIVQIIILHVVLKCIHRSDKSILESLKRIL